MDPLSEVFGSTPSVAMFRKLKYGEEQKKAIGANIAAFPDIAKLGDLYQSYLTEQMNTLLPGFSNILATGARTTQQTLSAAEPLLRGEIPRDVQEQVRRSDAYTASQGGYAGSGMARNLVARDFGLTSLNLINQGANLAAAGGNAAQRWSSIAKGETLDPSNFLITPQQQANFDLQNAVLRQQSLQNKYNVEAAPNPVAKGISDTVISLVGAYLGAGKGGSTSQVNSFTPASSVSSMPYSNYGTDPWYGGSWDYGAI